MIRAARPLHLPTSPPPPPAALQAVVQGTAGVLLRLNPPVDGAGRVLLAALNGLPPPRRVVQRPSSVKQPPPPRWVVPPCSRLLAFSGLWAVHR